MVDSMGVVVAVCVVSVVLVGLGFCLGALVTRARRGHQGVADQERAAFAAQRVAELTEEKNLLADQLADVRVSAAQERQGLEAMVRPVADNLSRLEAALSQTEAARRENLGGLGEQLRDLAESNARVSAEAASLKHALRSSNTRGRWGEVQLRRVVEVSGMVQHVDFEEQLSGGENASSRADLVVRLPDGVSIAVDAKVPYSAYDRACDAQDPDSAAGFMRAHAKDVRAHVDALAKRAYWNSYGTSPGFCVMFVPGDALLEAALMTDPTLWEHASRSRVLFATPTSLIALLRMASLGWARDSKTPTPSKLSKWVENCTSGWPRL